jgi:hypothetical protein
MGRNRLVMVGFATALIALAAPAASSAAGDRATVVVKTVKVGAPGNPSVGIVPFTDAVYPSCADAPSTSTDCATVGGVAYRFRIGRFETGQPSGSPSGAGRSWHSRSAMCSAS